MDYSQLSPEDFDALVTGELTHFAIWLEGELIGIISDHFVTKKKKSDFERLLLRRDGLTFQDKIEIVRAMSPLFASSETVSKLKSLLGKVEDFKATRNALAHGVDVTPDNLSKPAIHVEIVNRAGRERVVIVTPDSHQKVLDEATALLEQLKECRAALKRV